MHGSQYAQRDMIALPPASAVMKRTDHLRHVAPRVLAEECPVALVYNGTSLAVVMATPTDLIDLALGFSLTEGIIAKPEEIESIDVVPHGDGIELRMWLAEASGRRLQVRRRQLVGPTGCGLCGIESLTEATRPVPQVIRAITLEGHQIANAIEALAKVQALNLATRATHAAGFYLPDDRLVLLREDVGRHNALDKLAGALASQNLAGSTGAVVLTSRVSVEMVQKTAVIGAGILIAISAPTALAVRTATACGISLVGVARGSAFEIFSHPDAVAPS